MENWQDDLRAWVEERPCAILRLTTQEWAVLSESKRGLNEFTIARSHSLFEHLKVPTLCLIYAAQNGNPPWRWKQPDKGLIGILRSPVAISSLETRVRVTRAVEISPATEYELAALIQEQPHTKNLQDRLSLEEPFIVLSPKLSRTVITALLEIPANQGPLRVVSSFLSTQKRFASPAAMQEDAISSALKAFGVPADTIASELYLVPNRETGLARVGIREDAVIQHEARQIPGFRFVGSDLTGSAFFVSDTDRLEVITANRLELEEVFGVDLIYLNLTKRNLVMVQYKMLEPVKAGKDTDWVYRPDGKLEDEIGRMDSFSLHASTTSADYRLNTQPFYLKFVKRNALLAQGSIITPLDHFKHLVGTPVGQGPKGGVRVSYDSLAGAYMRSGTFLDLIHSGYLGTFASDTDKFETLIREILKANRGVVAAIQTLRQRDQWAPRFTQKSH
jgi:hypothetical protein